MKPENKFFPISNKVDLTNWYQWCSHLPSCKSLNLCAYPPNYNDLNEENWCLKHKYYQLKSRKKRKGKFETFLYNWVNGTFSSDYFSKILLATTLNVLEIPHCIDHLPLLSTSAKLWSYGNSIFDLMPYGDCSEENMILVFFFK